MKKKIKLALMGCSVVAVGIAVAASVVSCAEITKNATTNSYFAYSYPEAAFSGGHITQSEINDIALGENLGTSKQNTASKTSIIQNNKIENATQYLQQGGNLSSVTSWYFNEEGSSLETPANSNSSLTNMSAQYSQAASNSYLTSNNGIAPISGSGKNAVMVPTWLQQNNTTLVSSLFTSVLNYIVGPISNYAYLNQQLKFASENASGLLRRCFGQINTQANSSSSFESYLQQNKLASNWNNWQSYFLNYNFGQLGNQSFFQDLINPVQSSNFQTTYYLYPADIFYTVQSAPTSTTSQLGFGSSNNYLYNSNSYLTTVQTITKTTKQGKTTTKTGSNITFNSEASLLKNILAAYMPQKPGNEVNSNMTSNNKTVNSISNLSYSELTQLITTAELSNIEVVFEYYCSSANSSNYTANQPINATINQNLTSINKDVEYPTGCTSNPFYHKYYEMSLGNLLVNLQDIGTYTPAKAATKNSAATAASTSYYAALNNVGPIGMDDSVKFTQVQQDKNGTYSLNYVNTSSKAFNNIIYQDTTANAWSFFNTPTVNGNNTVKAITNLVNMQQNIANQIQFFENINANVKDIQNVQAAMIFEYSISGVALYDGLSTKPLTGTIPSSMK